MTTFVTIHNHTRSNGDLIVDGAGTCEGPIRGLALRPGEEKSVWITNSSALIVTEKWPTRPKNAVDESGGAIISECGDSGELWAKAFVNQFPAADEDTLRAWFQNAIEAADTVRRERRESPPPAEAPPTE